MYLIANDFIFYCTVELLGERITLITFVSNLTNEIR